MLLVLSASAANVYLYIAIGFTTFFVLQTFFTFIGLGDNFEFDSDFDGEVDLDMDFTEGIGMALHLFTIRGIIAFFMLFGWTGYFLANSELSGFVIFIIAFIAGTIMLVLVSLLYYLLIRISDSGTLDYNDAIGKQGTVYVPIPNRNEGIGKVQIVVGESLRTLDAIAKDNAIKTGQQVIVLGVINEMLEVAEIKLTEEDK